MSVPSKIHDIPLVKIQQEERLAATSERNLASSQVTGCGEARGMRCWAATQVKGSRHEILVVSMADVVHLTEGRSLIVDSPKHQSWDIAGSSGTWQCDTSPTRSKTLARYQRDIMRAQETQSVLFTGVCPTKPIDGKIVQTALWESDQLIVLTKQGNVCGGKGLAQEPFGQGHIFHTQRRVKDVNKTGPITYPENGRVVLLKSRMRENHKSDSVKGLIAAYGRRGL